MKPIVISALLLLLAVSSQAQNIRAGIIGLDTSHVLAFTKTLNAEPQKPEAMGVRVVAAYPQGSKDIESSTRRVPEYTKKVGEMGVKIVGSIDELLDLVDVVFLETNDGRPHLEQIRPCLAAGKPVFIDKPVAGSLKDAIAIFKEAKEAGVPVFSSSALRFGKDSQDVRGGSIGKVARAETRSPALLEPTHPDLFWYGIHGVESLFTVMGTGCVSVKRGVTEDGKIRVTGTWVGGRTGIFTEDKGYGGKAVGEKGEAPVGSSSGYDPLLFAAVHFFRTGTAPVTPEETLEIYAFMEAADESKRRGGAEVTLKEVMEKASIPDRSGMPMPSLTHIRTDPGQPRIEVVRDQGPNATEWALAPLDEAIPADIRQNLALLREDLLDEGAKGAKAGSEAYQLASDYCDKLLAALSQREIACVQAGYQAAQADANKAVSNQALDARRNHQMSWPQYAREESQRTALRESEANKADVKKQRLKVEWATRSEEMRTILDKGYRQFREAMR